MASASDKHEASSNNDDDDGRGGEGGGADWTNRSTNFAQSRKVSFSTPIPEMTASASAPAAANARPSQMRQPPTVVQASPVMGAAAPRNRRRLFRDISYTNRAMRRDQLPGAKAAPLRRRRGEDSALLALGEDDADDTGDGGGNNSHGERRRRQTILREGSDGPGRRATLMGPIPNLLRGSSTKSNSNNRRESVGDNDHQYHIPPPEEGTFSLLEGFHKMYSLAFGDLAMAVYEASFYKVLLFFFVMYLIFVYIFVVVLILVDRYSSESACINDLGVDLSVRAHFEFAFEHSWTVSIDTMKFKNCAADLFTFDIADLYNSWVRTIGSTGSNWLLSCEIGMQYRGNHRDGFRQHVLWSVLCEAFKAHGSGTGNFQLDTLRPVW